MADTAAPRVSVVICTRNRAAQLRQALLAVLSSEGLAASDYEVLVVDNGSTDETRLVVEEVQRVSNLAQGPRVAYVSEPNVGLSRARNAGVRAAAGTVVAFTDDDCVPSREWLRRLLEVFGEAPRPDVVFGRVEADGPAIGLDGLSVKDTHGAAWYEPPKTPVGFGHGNNFAVRAAVFGRMAGFDPLLGAGGALGAGEDCDFAYRVHASGGCLLFDSRPCVRHATRTDERDAARTYVNYARGRGAFYAKHIRRGDSWPWRWWWWELHDGLARCRVAQGRRRFWIDLAGTITGFLAYWLAAATARELQGADAPGAGKGPERVLAISPLVPFPADEGRKRRQSTVIRSLAHRFHTTLVLFAEPGAASSRALEVEPLADVVMLDRNGARGRRRPRYRLARHLDYWCALDPWFVRERDDRQLSELLREASAVPWSAVVVFNLPISGRTRPWLRRLKGQGARVVLDGDDYESAKQWRLLCSLPRSWEWLKQWVEWLRIRRYERRWLPDFSQVWMSHEADAAALRRRGVNATVVPNTVELPELNGQAEGEPPWDCVFVGMMGYVANVDAVRWFAQEVWPRIRALRPRARFAVVGKRPAPEVLALDGHDGIVVTGAVKDVADYLRSAKVAVVPIRLGGGTRIKVLDAFANGLAVVSTPVGVEGLAVAHARHALIASSPEAFAEACVRLFDDGALRRNLGQAARRHVEARYAQPALESRLAELLPLNAERAS